MKKRRVRRHEVSQPLAKSYRLIPLTQGANAIVDYADFDWLQRWNWTLRSSNSGRYAFRKDSANRNVYMHRLILDCGENEDCDHRNFNSLDNRRANLRKCSHSQNKQHNRGNSGASSAYVGVSWIVRLKKWRASVTMSGIYYYCGLFENEDCAARARDLKAQKLFGQFTHLNFP